MFKHNLLLIYRNFRLNKSAFFINLIGLSSGLICCLTIFLWVLDELSVDKFHEKEARIYQVMQKKQVPGDVLVLEDAPGPLPGALAAEMPEVEYAAGVMSLSLWSNSDGILSYNGKHTKVNGLFAGKDFFNIFSYKLIEGNKNQVLADPNGIVISDELAERMFNTTKGVTGKILELNNSKLQGPFRIAGIFEKVPANSTMQFDALFTYDLYLNNDPGAKNWRNANPFTYVLLREGSNAAGFNAKIEHFVQRKDEEAKNRVFAVKYADHYLYGRYENGVQQGGRINYVRLFTLIAVFVLLIACINFVNLSTARASTRMKEIGVKKVMGAVRQTLMVQFLGEAFLLTLAALLIALLAVYFLLPSFNDLTGKHISLQFGLPMILTIVGVTVVTGLLAGSYPAIYLSRFSPMVIFRGARSTPSGEFWIRKGLVVFQYAISMMLIVFVLITYEQITLIQTKNLGYQKDNIVLFKAEGNINKNLENFLAGLRRIPGVVSVTNMYGSMVGGFGTTSNVSWSGQSAEDKIQFANQEVGYDFVETLGLELKDGRGFSQKFGNEQNKVIFNEKAVNLMGLKDPVGKTIFYGTNQMQVIGVVKDFHFESMYEDIKPSFLRFTPDGGNILVKIKAGTEKQTIKQLADLYNSYFQSEIPFEFEFLDQEYQALYNSENRVMVLSRFFAGVAIVISCLGLFGLAAFTAKKRYKEIGIRKTLGSSDLGIVWLLVSDFTKTILVAIVLGFVSSYFLVNQWLNNFAYRVSLQAWYFVLAAVLILIIAWVTVSVHTVKATKINLARCLRVIQ
jgi:ABC-type antimicrobial peptide transport system permease subunit